MISKSVDGISVIICCYNSSWVISRCLDALKKQIVSEDINWEVVIVDNNCSDNTVEIANSSLSTSGLDYTIVKESEPGLLNARKKGVSVVKYSFIIFCDDDNFLSSNYVDVAYKTLKENPRIGALGGKGIAEFESEPDPDILPFIGNYAVGSQKGHDNWLYGAGMAVRTALVEDIYKNQKCYLVGRKGNKLLAGDDTELSMAIVLRGYGLAANDDISFTHVLRSNRLSMAYLKSMLDGFILVTPVIDVFKNVLIGGGVFNIIKRYLTIFAIIVKNTIIPNKNVSSREIANYQTLLNAYHYWGFKLFVINREWKNIKSHVRI